MPRSYPHAPLLQAASKLSHVECDLDTPFHHAISAIRITLAEDDIDYNELLHLSENIIRLITNSLDLPTIHDASDMPAALTALSTIDSDRPSHKNADILISAIRLLMQHNKNIKAAATIPQPRLFTEGKVYQAASKLLKYCQLHANASYKTEATLLQTTIRTPVALRADITRQTKDLLFKIFNTLGIATPKNTSDIPACEAYILSTDTSNKPLLLNALRWLQSTLPAPDTHTASPATPKHT